MHVFLCANVQSEQILYLSALRQSLSLNRKLGWAKLAGQWALGITSLHSSGASVTGLHSHTWILTWVLGILAQALMFAEQAL